MQVQTTENAIDGTVYYGKVVLEGPVDIAEVEEVLHQLKHCFMAEYDKCPEWMMEEFRKRSSKHSRISITYYVTQIRDRTYVKFCRSMARNSCGRLCKITNENVEADYPVTKYAGQRYFVLPLSTREANSLMGLFATMIEEALGACFLEQAIRAEKPKAEKLEGAVTVDNGSADEGASITVDVRVDSVPAMTLATC